MLNILKEYNYKYAEQHHRKDPLYMINYCNNTKQLCDYIPVSQHRGNTIASSFVL